MKKNNFIRSLKQMQIWAASVAAEIELEKNF